MTITNTKLGTVRLPQREAMYLRNAKFLPDDLARMVNAAKYSKNNEIVISVSEDISELFRDIFTRQLAKVGFDEAYDLTSEGKVLEDLIDLFYFEKINGIPTLDS